MILKLFWIKYLCRKIKCWRVLFYNDADVAKIVVLYLMNSIYFYRKNVIFFNLLEEIEHCISSSWSAWWLPIRHLPFSWSVKAARPGNFKKGQKYFLFFIWLLFVVILSVSESRLARAAVHPPFLYGTL